MGELMAAIAESAAKDPMPVLGEMFDTAIAKLVVLLTVLGGVLESGSKDACSAWSAMSRKDWRRFLSATIRTRRRCSEPWPKA